MNDLTRAVKGFYAAFGRGDFAEILRNATDDILWESEGPSELVYTGIRRGPNEALGFFTAIAQEHADPKLTMTDFVASGDTVAAFGRYEATIRKTGKRVDVPVAHLFKFHLGGVGEAYIAADLAVPANASNVRLAATH